MIAMPSAGQGMMAPACCASSARPLGLCSSTPGPHGDSCWQQGVPCTDAQPAMHVHTRGLLLPVAACLPAAAALSMHVHFVGGGPAPCTAVVRCAAGASWEAMSLCSWRSDGRLPGWLAGCLPWLVGGRAGGTATTSAFSTPHCLDRLSLAALMTFCPALLLSPLLVVCLPAANALLTRAAEVMPLHTC